MSWTGKCPECGVAAMERNVTGLTSHTGPAFDHWRRRCLAAFGVTLPDE